MDYCFLRFTTTRGSLIRKYGISEAESYLAECIGECDATEESDTVALTVCFYRNENGGVGQFIFSSELILADNEEYYKGASATVRYAAERRASAYATAARSNMKISITSTLHLPTETVMA